MTALVRAVLGLLIEVTAWCAVVIGVAAIVSAAYIAVGTPRRPTHIVGSAAVGAALAVGVANRASFPHLWSIGPTARSVPVVWAAVGATAVCVVMYVRERSAGMPSGDPTG